MQIRRVVKRALVEHPAMTRTDVLAAVEQLWAEPLHERRMSAAFLLEARADNLVVQDLHVLERLIREARGWALVDVLAGDVAGCILVRHPQAGRITDRWACDPEFWLRRAALLSTRKPHRAGQPLDRFFGYADLMLDETEFFIRKAIGWVLREAGKEHADAVAAWLEPRASRVSGVTIREAVKYLPRRVARRCWPHTAKPSTGNGRARNFW